MTILMSRPRAVRVEGVADVLTRALTRLGEDVHRDGLAAHDARIRRLADDVRRSSPLLAEVLTGPYAEPMRERALARAVRLVLLRAEEHPTLAHDLA